MHFWESAIRRASGSRRFEEKILELVHAGVGEDQRRIIHRRQRRAGHDQMLFAGKKIQKLLADFRGGREGSVVMKSSFGLAVACRMVDHDGSPCRLSHDVPEAPACYGIILRQDGGFVKEKPSCRHLSGPGRVLRAGDTAIEEKTVQPGGHERHARTPQAEVRQQSSLVQLHQGEVKFRQCRDFKVISIVIR